MCVIWGILQVNGDFVYPKVRFEIIDVPSNFKPQYVTFRYEPVHFNTLDPWNPIENYVIPSKYRMITFTERVDEEKKCIYNASNV